MPGYEELTPDQLWIIFWGVFVMVMTFAISMGVIRPLLNWRTAKCIQFKMDKEVAKQITKDLQKPSWFTMIREWWKKRKEIKKESDPFAKYLEAN